MFNSTLIGVAAKHGLKPVCDWGDSELNDCFDEVTITRAKQPFWNCVLYAASVAATHVWYQSWKFCVFWQADAHKPIKHFHPRFPSHSDQSLTHASALFAAFVFQKAGTDQQHHSAGMHRPTHSNCFMSIVLRDSHML